MEIIKLSKNSEYDELWLKDKIAEKPELLGLGRLRLLEREKNDRIAGITDLIMESSDRKNLFVIEVMVGEIDESHIVRSILYWLTEKNMENRKNTYPILIAENFNNRFFEVLYFLTRFIPFILLQVTVLGLGNKDIEGIDKVEFIFQDVPCKGNKFLIEKFRRDTNRESFQKNLIDKLSEEEFSFYSHIESEIKTFSNELQIQYNKDSISYGFEDVSKVFLSITWKRNLFFLEGVLPFHWETRGEEFRYNFSKEEISALNEKFILKLDPKNGLEEWDKLRVLLKESFDEYNREFGSSLE